MSKGSIVFVHQHGGGLRVGPDNPDPTRGFIRGTEIALVRLAQELQALDWNVLVEYENGPIEWYEDPYGVRWGGLTPISDYHVKHQDKFWKPDVVVSLLTPNCFRWMSGRLNILWGHYAHLNVGRLDSRIHHYVLGTDWHQWSVREHDKAIDADKCVIIGSGLDLERYEAPRDIVYGRLLYSSSADRGLYHLLRFWSILKSSMPHLSLKVFYDPRGMEPWRWHHEARAEMARLIDAAKGYDGVEFVGPVDPWTLAQEQLKADLFVYPCDPIDRTETFCLSIMEMHAAGVPVLTTAVDCLPEMYGRSAFFMPLPVNDLTWVEQVGHMLSNRTEMESLVPVGKELAAQFTWRRVAQRWDAFLTRRLEIPDDDRETWLAHSEDISNLQRVAIATAERRGTMKELSTSPIPA